MQTFIDVSQTVELISQKSLKLNHETFLSHAPKTSRTTISIRSVKLDLHSALTQINKSQDWFNCLCKHFFAQYIPIFVQLTAHQER